MYKKAYNSAATCKNIDDDVHHKQQNPHSSPRSATSWSIFTTINIIIVHPINYNIIVIKILIYLLPRPEFRRRRGKREWMSVCIYWNLNPEPESRIWNCRWRRWVLSDRIFVLLISHTPTSDTSPTNTLSPYKVVLANVLANRSHVCFHPMNHEV